jgi:hypothetical protein
MSRRLIYIQDSVPAQYKEENAFGVPEYIFVMNSGY